MIFWATMQVLTDRVGLFIWFIHHVSLTQSGNQFVSQYYKIAGQITHLPPATLVPIGVRHTGHVCSGIGNLLPAPRRVIFLSLTNGCYLRSNSNTKCRSPWPAAAVFPLAIGSMPYCWLLRSMSFQRYLMPAPISTRVSDKFILAEKTKIGRRTIA